MVVCYNFKEQMVDTRSGRSNVWRQLPGGPSRDETAGQLHADVMRSAFRTVFRRIPPRRTPHLQHPPFAPAPE